MLSSLDRSDRFVERLMEMALNGGYITSEEKQEFLMPLREIAAASVIF